MEVFNNLQKFDIYKSREHVYNPNASHAPHFKAQPKRLLRNSANAEPFSLRLHRHGSGPGGRDVTSS